MKKQPRCQLVYLDNAATTKILPQAAKAMISWLEIECSNPSASYFPAQKARQAIEEARAKVAESINASADEIYFTSGGTESCNLAVIGSAIAMQESGQHIVTSRIEHPAVLNSMKYLESVGFHITYLDVNAYGVIDINKLKQSLSNETILVSIMTANNEIGTLEPVDQIGEITHERGITFHTDAVQAYGQIDLDMQDIGVDILSASGHKIGGPKGSGFTFVRKGVKISPILYGGKQERGVRAGTENLLAIVGIGEASSFVHENLASLIKHNIKIRDYCIGQLFSTFQDIRLNGPVERRLPNNVNISFKNINGRDLVNLLGFRNICTSSGSACMSGEFSRSHVLEAIGVSDEYIEGALRITVGRDTLESDIDFTISALKEIINQLH